MQTLDELFAAKSAAECKTGIETLFTNAGFNTADFENSGSVGKTLIEVLANIESGVQSRQKNFFSGSILQSSMGSLLDIVASAVYGLTRYPATYEEKEIEFYNTTNENIVLSAGTMRAIGFDGKIYYNKEDYTMLPVSHGQPIFIAELPGATNHRISSILTPVVGLNYVGDSVSIAGKNEEFDKELQSRCILSLSAYSYGMSADSYKYWAMNGHEYASLVKRIKVKESLAGDGVVDVILATNTDKLEANQIAVIDAHLQQKAGGLITVNTSSVNVIPVSVNASVLLKKGSNLSAFTNAAIDGLVNLYSSLDIGATLYKSAIIEVLTAPASVIDVSINSPTANLTCADNEIFTYSAANTFSITFTS